MRNTHGSEVNVYAGGRVGRGSMNSTTEMMVDSKLGNRY
eukprot:COSAG02_NODE_2654_length_8316_cov_4.044161_3_plen_39_part_00